MSEYTYKKTTEVDKFHTFLEYLALAIFPITTGILFWQCFNHLPQGYSLYVIVAVSVIAGYTVSDFSTGLVHWLADTYGSESTPFVGANFIEPFRWHHIEPKAMCEHSLASTIGNSCMLAVPLQTILFSWLYYGNITNIWICSFLFMSNFAIIGTILTNQFHKWAHMPEEVPKFVRVLQKMRLVLEPVHHDIHHSTPYNTYYCVTSGWCNAILHKINFWRNAEKLLGWFGIHPHTSANVSPETKVISTS